MARVTVEDCIDKVESPYELVLVAKERTTQLNAGIEPSVDRDNDKHTVIALREIAKENIKVSDLDQSAVHKLRRHVKNIIVASQYTTLKEIKLYRKKLMKNSKQQKNLCFLFYLSKSQNKLYQV